MGWSLLTTLNTSSLVGISLKVLVYEMIDWVSQIEYGKAAQCTINTIMVEKMYLIVLSRYGVAFTKCT